MPLGRPIVTKSPSETPRSAYACARRFDRCSSSPIVTARSSQVTAGSSGRSLAKFANTLLTGAVISVAPSGGRAWSPGEWCHAVVQPEPVQGRGETGALPGDANGALVDGALQPRCDLGREPGRAERRARHLGHQRIVADDMEGHVGQGPIDHVDTTVGDQDRVADRRRHVAAQVHGRVGELFALAVLEAGEQGVVDLPVDDASQGLDPPRTAELELGAHRVSAGWSTTARRTGGASRQFGSPSSGPAIGSPPPWTSAQCAWLSWCSVKHALRLL